MLDIRTARDRAYRRAIETGEMPNFDLIHTMQTAGGYQPCFGRAQGSCDQTVCRFHVDCMALATFQPPPKSPIEITRFRPLQRPFPAAARTYRDGRGTSRNAEPINQAVTGDNGTPATIAAPARVSSQLVAEAMSGSAESKAPDTTPTMTACEPTTDAE
jgi:hypothetical protein